MLILLLSSSAVSAEQNTTIDEESNDSVTTSDNTKTSSAPTTMVGRVDLFHDTVSGGLEATAKSVDDFFAEDTVYEESTKSYLRMGLDSVLREEEGLGFSGAIKLKIDLPRTKKRLRLLIESDTERGDLDNLEDRPVDAAQGKDYSLAIERSSSRLKKWNVRPSLGIKLHSKIDTFFRVRSHRYFPMDKWLLRLGSQASWLDSKGYEAEASLSLDRPLAENWLFRYSMPFGWREEEMFRHTSQEFSLYHQIDSRQQMAYQFIAAADDAWDQWLAKSYTIAVRYRRGLYKKWLFGEIIPQWNYLKGNQFHSDTFITFRLEVVFGERYRQ